MTENELRERITDLEIDIDTELLLTIIQNGNNIVYPGRIDFWQNGYPGIENDRVGIRIQYIVGGAYTPYLGGLPLQNLIDVSLQ